MNRFRVMRYQTGLSLAVAAEQSGVGRTTLSRLENGHTNRITADVAQKLASFYDVDVTDLIDLSTPDREAA